MKYNSLEKNLKNKLDVQIRDVAPGVIVRAYQAGRLICDVGSGAVFPYYDLASLTKIIFTTQIMMELFDLKKWNLDTKVNSVLSWFPSQDTKITQLLNHTSGLPWWIPFYKDIPIHLSVGEKREFLKNILAQQKIVSSEKSIYSDIGFIILSYLIEELTGKKLIEVWQDVQNRYYSGTTFEFHVNNQCPQNNKLYAPSEECSWRGKLIQGEVHDENAWSLGGISTHAGLFGSIDDLGWYSLLLRSQILGIARYDIKQKTAQLFIKRSIDESVGDWGLGFMLPTSGSSSSGKYFDVDSIGHTGFTGTSIWYDPKNDLAVAILSNRTLYGRENKQFNQLRPQIHDWIVEGLRRASI